MSIASRLTSTLGYWSYHTIAILNTATLDNVSLLVTTLRNTFLQFPTHVLYIIICGNRLRALALIVSYCRFIYLVVAISTFVIRWGNLILFIVTVNPFLDLRRQNIENALRTCTLGRLGRLLLADCLEVTRAVERNWNSCFRVSPSWRQQACPDPSFGAIRNDPKLLTEYGGGWLLPTEVIGQSSIFSSISGSVGSILSLSSVRRSFSPGKASRIVLYVVEDTVLLVSLICGSVSLTSLIDCLIP